MGLQRAAPEALGIQLEKRRYKSRTRRLWKTLIVYGPTSRGAGFCLYDDVCKSNGILLPGWLGRGLSMSS